MKITKRPFGTLADGTAVSCWTMENAHGLRAELLDYGATICSVQVPDRAGRLIDVVLGYDDLAGYAGNPSFYGATIGRFGNRIGGAEFALNGKTYWLAKNNGENHLHGGLRGFDKYVWQGTEEPDGVLHARLAGRRGGVSRHADGIGEVQLAGRRADAPLYGAVRSGYDFESDKPQLF